MNVPDASQESGLPWTLGLTRKLQAPVQLVAPTISCSRIHGIGPPALDGVHESVPHVSWQAFAMTQVVPGGCKYQAHALARLSIPPRSAALAVLILQPA